MHSDAGNGLSGDRLRLTTMDRRQFIQAGVAGSAASALGGASLLAAAFAALKTRLALHLALFDERSPVGREFGAAIGRHRLRTYPVRGDVTEVWYSELHPQWTRAPAAVAGLTTHEPLFCLERLSWDHGMRVVYEGRHRPLPDGGIEHTLSTAWPEPGGESAAAAGSWASSVATVITQMETDGMRALPIFRHDALGHNRQITCSDSATREHARVLYSWVIAPVAKA